jgi:uncharacterized repeat protein (TIGR03803 family)
MSLTLAAGFSVTAGVWAATNTLDSRFLPKRVVPTTLAPRAGTVRMGPASSQESVLYTFRGTPDGSGPSGGLVLAKGALYGAASGGGAKGYGAVFKLTPSGGGYTESVVYSFQGGSDGATPLGGVVADAARALYGTTSVGGVYGYGTVFKLTPVPSGYTESILHTFQSADGQNPRAGLFIGKAGALFGTTWGGGVGGNGLVFKLTPSGSGYAESVLYSFRGKPDGSGPSGRVLAEANGVVYGTTTRGGLNDFGTAFKLTPSGSFYVESVLHSFGFGNEGVNPYCHLIRDSSGALYGTTASLSSGSGWGAVFKLTPSGSTYTETVLHAFRTFPDGATPLVGLTRNRTGAFYGTTYQGGQNGWGTAFKLTPSGSTYTESVLYSFRNGNGDGAYPSSGLLLSPTGALYGETSLGGVNNNFGTVYKLIP